MGKFNALVALCLCWTVSLSPGHITAIVDGDTVKLAAFQVWPGIAASGEIVRVLGVDTPERGQPNFEIASGFTATWLSKGPFTMKACRRDSFGRLLGEITRGEENLATALISAGWGVKR